MISSIIFIILFGIDVLFMELLVHFKVSYFYARKLGHILAALIAFFMIDFLSLNTFIFVSSLLILVNIASKLFKVLKSIEKSDPYSLGSILFPISVLIVGIVFWKEPVIYKGSIMILGFADSLGALVGKTFGRHKISIRSPKTWEGFITFIIVAAIIFVSTTYLHLDQITVTQLGIVLMSSVLLSGVELISPYGSDNLFITLLSSGVFYLIY